MKHVILLLFLFPLLSTAQTIPVEIKVIESLMADRDSCKLEKQSAADKDYIMAVQDTNIQKYKNRIYKLELESSEKSFRLDEDSLDRINFIEKAEKKKERNGFIQIFGTVVIIILTVLAAQ